MDANRREYSKGDILFKEEVYDIMGCAMEVHKALGHGFREKGYERGLVVEFGLRQIPFQQQAAFPIYYKGVEVDRFVPDLIVYNKIIVDTKVIQLISDRERGQMLNYLKVTQFELGLLINFSNPRLEWERIVRTKKQHSPA